MLELARAISGAPGLRLRGLQAYQGAAQHLRKPAERAAAIASAVADARRMRELLVGAGIACDIVTGAGTGTWQHERDSGVYDELQPGSYVFMDADYGRNIAGAADLAFEQSLFVVASVMSTPASDRAIIDAGLKAFAFDSGLPLVHARGGAEYVKASDEHGVLRTSDGSAGDTGRADLAGARSLRPDGQPLRLDRRGARWRGRGRVAGRGARRAGLNRAAGARTAA